jgi:tight adherence protein B
VILVAALCVALCSTLLAGHLVGHPLELRPWRGSGASNRGMRRWLAEAGLGVPPTQFVLGCVGIGGCVFLAAWLATGVPLLAVVPAIGAALVPRAYYERRRVDRLRVLQRAWPDGLRDISSSIAAGRSITQALTELSAHGPETLRRVFARFGGLARMLGPIAALEVVKAELADPTSDRVLEVLILAQERGGAVVARVLDDLVEATTKDVKLLDELESEGLEMKINARAVLILPWLVLLALTVRAGAFRDFYETGAGLLVVVVGVAMSGLGAWWIGRLGRTAGEQRVFDGGVATGGPS